MDIIESCIFSMDKIGIRDWPMDSPLYSKNGLLIHIPLFDNDEFGYLISQQADKEFSLFRLKESLMKSVEMNMK